MTTPMTNHDMLESVVRAMIDGEARIIINLLQKPSYNQPKWYVKDKTVYVERYYKECDGEGFTGFVMPDVEALSLPDLLANAEAMKVYGDKKTCIFDSLEEKGCLACNINCFELDEMPEGFYIPRWKYIALKADEMLLDGGDAIKYLYDNLPKGGERK